MKIHFLPTTKNFTNKLVPDAIFSAGEFHAHSNLTKFYKKDSLADIRRPAGDEGRRQKNHTSAHKGAQQPGPVRGFRQLRQERRSIAARALNAGVEASAARLGSPVAGHASANRDDTRDASPALRGCCAGVPGCQEVQGVNDENPAGGLPGFRRGGSSRAGGLRQRGPCAAWP